MGETEQHNMYGYAPQRSYGYGHPAFAGPPPPPASPPRAPPAPIVSNQMTGLPVFTPRGVSASDAINQRLDQLEKSRRPASPPRASYKPALATTSENFPGGDGFVDDIHRRLDMLGSCGSSNAAPKALKKACANAIIREAKATVTAPKAAASGGLKFKAHEVNQASMDNYLKNLFEIGDTNG